MSREVIDADAQVVEDCKKIKHKHWAGKEAWLYNANIHPIRYNTFAGVIWYQGCANVSSNPTNYAHSLEVLVNFWRKQFANPDMPFYLVQLVPYTYAGITGAQLRESHKSGTAEFIKNNDGTHTVKLNAYDYLGNNITCNWTGVIEEEK